MNPLGYLRSLPMRIFGPAGGGGTRSLLGNGAGMPSAVLSGVDVTPQSALALTAAYAAINTVATDSAALWLGAYRRRKAGGSDPATDLPVHDLLYTAANRETPAFFFRQTQMGHALGWGNGYAEIVRDTRDGSPRELHLLSPHPSKTKPVRDDRGRLWYEVDGDDGRRKRLRPEDVLHVRGLGFDGLVGYSPVALARQAIGLGIAAEQFGAALFGNGSQPRGVLKTPQKLSKDAAGRLREQFEMVHQGSYNAHRLAVLEQGLEWQATSINPDDAQFLATRQFQVIEIARMYRVPPHKIGDYSRATFANIEEANLDYVMTCLLGWVKAVEAEFNWKLLTAADRASGIYLKHNMASILRGNMLARGAFYKTMFSLGVFSPNDIAELEDHNPVAGGDTHFVPMNMASVDAADPGSEAKPTEQAPDPADGLPLTDPSA